MKNIEIFEHTADVGIEIKAKNEKDIFKNAAKGLLKLIFKSGKIKGKIIQKDICLKAETKEELLHNFLNEILFLIFVKKIYVKATTVIKINDKKIKAKVHGYFLKNIGDYIIRELKSVTYHNLEIKKQGLFFKAKIIVDI